MKKISHKILISLILLMVVGGTLIPHVARADTLVGSLLCIFQPTACTLGSFIASNFMIGLLADIGNEILKISSWFLSIAGVVLNVSIILTMNIKAIYEATPAIKDVWVVIRNISSIFIIFILLYTSIMTILDMGKTSIKDLIGKIIMVGLLINFSLFFTKVAIDASNMVSLQFYRAIVPNSSQISTIVSKEQLTNILTSSFRSGGISDVFMSNLKITKIYDKKTNTGLLTDSDGGKSFKIVISAIAGSGLMIVAALSFLAAAIMFIIRLVILLLLLGFSPVYFVGMIFPEIKKSVSDKWMGWLEQQLIFMPAYLLFMYVALRFISTINPAGVKEGFFGALEYTQTGAVATNGMFVSSIGIIIQYVIAFILINVPLIVALQTGGVSAKWGGEVKKWAGGFLGQHTFGRAAKTLQGALASSSLASRAPNLAVLANKTLGGVAGSDFGGSKGGYEKRFKEFSKARSDYAGKNLKLSVGEKRMLDKNIESSVKADLAVWDEGTDALIRETAEAQKEYNDAAILGGPLADRKKKELDELKAKFSKRSEEREKYFQAQEKEKRGALEAKALKDKKEQFARRLEGGLDPFTKKARKDAADAIRKELKKGKKDKALDAIKEAFSDDKPEKEEKSEAKPKP